MGFGLFISVSEPEEDTFMDKCIAMVAGATGLVGQECLCLLATDDKAGEVRAGDRGRL